MKNTIFLLFLLSVLIPLSANDVYVRQGNNGDGTKENPYGFVWIALFRADPGDVIHVAEGHYYGKDSAGIFTIDKPDITISGGYNSDFSERNPFLYFTVFKQIENFNGIQKATPVISADGYQKNFSYMIIDGIIFDCMTRNKYNVDGEIMLTECMEAYTLYFKYVSNVKIRNCIFLNSSWGHIHLHIQGRENEISNCFLLNTFHNSVYLREYNDFKIRINNNTIGFSWNHTSPTYPEEGKGVGIRLDDIGDAVVENNIILYTQSAGIINNNNPNNSLLNNIFFQCQEGIYKFIDRYYNSTKNMLLWKKEDLELLNLYPDVYQLYTAEDNIYLNPDLDIDIYFLSNLVNNWSSNSENIAPELLEEWRRNQSYFTGMEDSAVNSRFGMAYSLENVIPALIFDGSQGVQTDVEFEEYSSGTGN